MLSLITSSYIKKPSNEFGIVFEIINEHSNMQM